MFASQRLWLCVLLTFSPHINLASAHIESCAGGCELALGNVNFLDVNATLGYYPNHCGSRLRAASVYLCMRTYCRPREISTGWAKLNNDCERYGNITLPPFSIINNFTDADVARLRQIKVNDTDLQTTLPVLPGKALFDVAFRTKDAWNNSVYTRHVYGNAMFWFWSMVIAFGVTKRFVRISAWTPTTYADEKQTAPSVEVWTRLKWLIQAYISIPASFSRNCSEPLGWCTVPPRLQSGLLFIFTSINIVLCCISYDVFEGNLYWTPFVQWMRYVADRTGIIATANLPIIWLFATRNNIVLYITGWSFDTAMQFHRWVARISTVEAVIHSMAYILLVIRGHSWAAFWNEWTLRYWNMGALATIVMCGLCAASLYPIRHYHYELFLFIHISLGILTLLGMWYHVEIFNGDYNWYLWPCVVIWLADRVGRLARLAYLSFPLQLSSLRYDQAANAVWLEIQTAVSFQPKPGEYYFLYLLHDRTFYQSHPFTMSSWYQPNGSSRPCLSFLIRPYDGFTGRIAELARQSASISHQGGVPRRVRVLVEGPYGKSHDLTKHDSLVFVVGGTGMAVALAYLDDMFSCVEGQQTRYGASHVRIIWAVQTLAMFEQVLDVKLKPRLDKLGASGRPLPFQLELEVFVTRQHHTQIVSSTAPPANPATPSAHASQELHYLAPENPPPDETIKEDDPSEQSPLLSPSSSPSSTPRPGSPQELSSPSHHYNLPQNVHLTIYPSQRPDIPTLVHEACHWHPSDVLTAHVTSPATQTGYSARGNEASRSEQSESLPSTNLRASSSTATEGAQPQPQHKPSFSPSARPRIALISCGPASLADDVRASLAETLRQRQRRRSHNSSKIGDLGDVDFWSESYSW